MNVFTMAHRITHRVLCQGSFLEMTQIYHESVCRPEFWFKKGIDIIQSNAMNFRRLRSSIFSRWIVMADVISYSEHLHHQQSFINASLHQWLLIIISMFSRISSFFFRLSCHNEKRTFSVSLSFSPQYTRLELYFSVTHVYLHVSFNENENGTLPVMLSPECSL